MAQPPASGLAHPRPPIHWRRAIGIGTPVRCWWRTTQRSQAARRRLAWRSPGRPAAGGGTRASARQSSAIPWPRSSATGWLMRRSPALPTDLWQL